MATTSAQPEFWDTRYKSGHTPWDFGGVQCAILDYISRHPHGGRALIPGCGSGYELTAFTAAGYAACALDFSPAAVARARRRLPPPLADCVALGDFFLHDYGGSFDVICERTFLCALHPERRPAYAARMAQLIRPGGCLAGLFYFETTAPDAGPPWGLAPDELSALLGDCFTLVHDAPSLDSLPIFSGKERWQEWRRT